MHSYRTEERLKHRRNRIMNSIALCAAGFSFGSGLSVEIGKRPMEIISGTALFATAIILCIALAKERV
jgi:hypothetical protein